MCMFNVEWKGKSFVFFNRVSEASSRPRTERRSVKNHHYNEPDSDEEESRSSYSFSPTPEPVPSAPPPQSNNSDSYYSGPFKALYDFESGKESTCRKKNYFLITSGVSLMSSAGRQLVFTGGHFLKGGQTRRARPSSQLSICLKCPAFNESPECTMLRMYCEHCFWSSLSGSDMHTVIAVCNVHLAYRI